jgi:hypothetical protein
MRFGGKWKASVFAFAAMANAAGASDSTVVGVYAMDHARSSSVHMAIDSCVSRMNVLKRAIARHLLEKDNVPSEHLSIHAGQAGLVISQGEDTPATCRLDGMESNWVDRDGTVYRLSCEQEQNGLSLVIKGKNGQCRNEYRWSDDESEVQVAVTVSSPLLPVPLNYLLDYRRPCTAVE